MSRVAAIDCGTNSIRLLVADVTESFDGTPALRDIYREQRVVRLGKGVDATGVLDPEALERTRVALADYTAVLRRKGTERVRMVATSATRDARNRDDFFGMVRATLGVDAEVISGDEEARLSFAGAVGELDPSDGPFVVVDTGGGSTELVVGELDADGATVRAAYSADIGSVRITERCLAGDPPTRRRGRRGPRPGRERAGRRVRRGAGRGRAHLGRRRGHDHHALGVRPAAAALRPGGGAPVPALGGGPAPGRRRAARHDPRASAASTRPSTPAGST